MHEKKDTSRSANSFCTGPHGQSFFTSEPEPNSTAPNAALRASGLGEKGCETRDVHSSNPLEDGQGSHMKNEPTFLSREERKKLSKSERQLHKKYNQYLWDRVSEPGRPDAPSDTDLMEESKVAEELQTHSRQTLQALVFVAAIVWGVLFVCTCIAYLSPIMPGNIPGQVVDTVENFVLTMPAGEVSLPPSFVACSQGVMFVANQFQVFRVENWKAVPEDCKGLDTEIVDLTILCNASSFCRPMVLPFGATNTVHDCHTGESLPLLQGPRGVDKIALASFHTPGDQLNSSMLTSRDLQVVQRRWVSQPKRGWKPLWAKMNLSNAYSPSVLGLDVSQGGKMFVFSHERGAWSKFLDITFIQGYDVFSLQSIGKWRVTQGSSVQEGCAMTEHTMIMLKQDGNIMRAHLTY